MKNLVLIKVFSFKWNPQLKEVIHVLQLSVLKQRLDSWAWRPWWALEPGRTGDLQRLSFELSCHGHSCTCLCIVELKCRLFPRLWQIGKEGRPQTLEEAGSLLSSWSLSQEHKCRSHWISHWLSVPQSRNGSGARENGCESVSCGCHDKVPQTERFGQQNFIVSHSGGWKYKIKVSVGPLYLKAPGRVLLWASLPPLGSFLAYWQQNSLRSPCVSVCFQIRVF